MTEPTGREEPAAQPSPDWPRLDPAALKDPVVAEALAPLDLLPDAPLEDHEAAYARLHDQLMDALNAGPADGAA